MKLLTVKSANYIGDYKVEIFFNDNKKKLVDFHQFLITHSHPQYNKYRETENFKRFKIENGNLIWGRNWDMIFPVYDLYLGKIN